MKDSQARKALVDACTGAVMARTDSLREYEVAAVVKIALAEAEKRGVLCLAR